MRPAPIALKGLRVLPLARPELVRLPGRHVGRQADFHLGHEQHQSSIRYRARAAGAAGTASPGASGTRTRPSTIRGDSTRSAARSRKFVASTGFRHSVAEPAANAIDAHAPSAPSYWLPTTASAPTARQWARISRDSANAVRATLMVTPL